MRITDISARHKNLARRAHARAILAVNRVGKIAMNAVAVAVLVACDFAHPTSPRTYMNRGLLSTS